METGWQNWGRTVGCTPVHVAAPTSEAALQELVRGAAARGGRVKVVGSGHSWTDIACTEDTHVRLDQMGGELVVADDRQSAELPAGMRLADLVERLSAEGLALPNLGSIAEQTVAGVVATGTHGTGVRTGNLSWS